MSVEVRFDGASVQLRDSKYQGDPATQPTITLGRSDWRPFLETVAGSAPELWRGLPTITHATDGLVTVHAGTGAQLTYFPEEWKAFRLGVGAEPAE